MGEERLELVMAGVVGNDGLLGRIVMSAAGNDLLLVGVILHC